MHADLSMRLQKAISKKQKPMQRPQHPIDVLRLAAVEENACLHCVKPGDDPDCGYHCYRQWRKENSIADSIDIKGPGKYGYGAYTKPGVTIKKGEYLDEYIGDIRPVVRQSDASSAEDDEGPGSLYRFEIEGTFVIDAERAGNWTRFMNSHCKPNVRTHHDCIGKRHVIIYQAIRDIGPEEELVYNYGHKYFKAAGIECLCGSCGKRKK